MRREGSPWEMGIRERGRKKGVLLSFCYCEVIQVQTAGKWDTFVADSIAITASY